MVWERPRVTTTSADDGQTAAALTFFFYGRLLSHVPRDIDNLPRALHYIFSDFGFNLFKGWKRGMKWASFGFWEPIT